MNKLLLLFGLVLYLSAPDVLSQATINRPDSVLSLSQAWQWAETESRGEDEAWLAYSFVVRVDERLRIAFSSTDNNYIRWNRASNPNWAGNWYFNNGGGWQNRYSISALQAGVQSAQQDFIQPRELLLLLRTVAGQTTEIHLVSMDALVEWRALPVYWLGEFAEEESFRHLLNVLPQFSQQSLQRTLIRTLALHQSADRDTVLISLLDHQDYNAIRPVILEALAIHKSATVQGQLAQVATDSNENLMARRIAISALSRYDNPANVRLLTELAGQTNPQSIRRESIESLSLFPGDSVLQVLEEILAIDENQTVVTAALFGLARHPNKYDRIAEVASSHKDAEIRETALELAAAMNGSRAFSLLRNRFLEDPNSDVREEALRSMDAAPAAQAVPFLLEIANDERIDEDLRSEAVDTLSNFPPDLVFPDLQRLAWSDGSEDVREDAIKALAELDHNSVNDLLLEIARNHPSNHTRREAMDELQDRVL